MTKLEAALEAVRRGFHVFPLAPNSKVPALSGDWHAHATQDESQIRQWWSGKSGFNIAGRTDHLLVIDVDPKKGGAEGLQELAILGDMPKTAGTITHSGGFHLMYALPPGVRVSNSAEKLAIGVDVRSANGYVVLPGSTIAGNPYKWANEKQPSPAPEWLIEEAGRADERPPNAGKRLVEEDDWATERALKYLMEEAAESSEGQRNADCVRHANRCFDFGLEIETCVPYIYHWSEKRCFPPMDVEEIRRTVRSAAKSRKNAFGCDHPMAPGFEAVEIAPRVVPPAPTRAVGLHYISLDAGADRALTHNAEPLIVGLLDCGAMSVVYGESNSGKSFTEMDKDFHIAAGLPWAGRKVKQGAVVWVAAEGGNGVYKRLAALRLHYKQPSVPFFVIPCPVDLRHTDADLKPMVDLIRKIEADSRQKVVKVTIDTLSRVMAGGDENSNVDMGILVHHFDHIRSSTMSHLAVIHHSGKDKARGARGHTALRAATDTEIEVDNKVMTATKQRDLEGGAALRFRLTPIRIGVDMRGNEVTSCYVEVGAEGDLTSHVVDLDGETAAFADCLFTELEKSLAIDNIEGKIFETKFAIKCATTINSGGMLMSIDARRHHVDRMLLKMLNSRWIKKSKRGQWVVLNAQNAQNAQT